MVRIMITLLLALAPIVGFAQVADIKIEEEKRGRRIMLYGLNETLEDLEVTIEVEGTGFRQSKRKPRGVRIPAASKVHLLNLMLNKGETPQYTVKQTVSDSISRRAIRKESTPIRIPTRERIIMYSTANCTTCDSLVATLERSPYKYENTYLAKDSITRKQVARGITRLDTIVTPLFNVKGVLNTEILNYEDLFETFIKKEE